MQATDIGIPSRVDHLEVSGATQSSTDDSTEATLTQSHPATAPRHLAQEGQGDLRLAVPPATTMVGSRATELSPSLSTRSAGQLCGASDETEVSMDTPDKSAHSLSSGEPLRKLDAHRSALEPTHLIDKSLAVGQQAPPVERTPLSDPYDEVPSRLSHSTPDSMPVSIALPELEQGSTTLPKPTRGEDQKHSCSICSRNYRRPYLLRDHMASHRGAGEKQYRCEFAECNLTFATRSNMKRHFKLRHRGTDSAHMVSKSIQATGVEERCGRWRDHGTGASGEYTTTRNPTCPSELLAEDEENKLTPQGNKLQLPARGLPIHTYEADSSTELMNKPTFSGSRKRVRTPDYASRVKIARCDTAYIPEIRTNDVPRLTHAGLAPDRGGAPYKLTTGSNRKYYGNTTALGSDVCDVDTLSLMLETRLSLSGSDSGPMESTGVIAGRERPTSPDFIESPEPRSLHIPRCPIFSPEHPTWFAYSKMVDTVTKLAAAAADYKVTVRVPTKRPRLALSLPPSKPPGGASDSVAHRCAQGFRNILKSESLSPHTLVQRLGMSGFHGFDYSSGSTREYADTCSSQGGGNGTKLRQWLGVGSVYHAAQEPNMDTQAYDIFRQPLIALFAGFLNIYANSANPEKPQLPARLATPLGFDALLQRKYSEGFLDGIIFMLSKFKLLGADGTRTDLPFFPKEPTPLHTGAGKGEYSACSLAAPRASSSQPSQVDSCAPTFCPRESSSIWPRLYAPVKPPFIDKILPHIAADGKHSHQNLAPTTDIVFPVADAHRKDPRASTEFKGKERQQHKCSTCNQSFRRPYLLRDHMQSKHHHGERRYACDFDECGRAFTTRSNMRKHFTTKHGRSKRTPAAPINNVE